ncbi:alpha-(1,3)-fucosyltransferase 10-like isoform X2 [Lineus longissimus]|uniref:alpha-(1,3)-fucosyltransferase 10-like isoform X2 n=1 Tax=Lineus longissimus TaxID=88925 RepID=UPI002B4F0439
MLFFRPKFLHLFGVICVFCTLIFIIYVTLTDEPDIDLYEMYKMAKENEKNRQIKKEAQAEQDAEDIDKKITHPIIIWWTPFTGEPGRVKKCGDVSCFFTVKRKYAAHKKTKAFMFYGTDFKAHDLPLPREPHHEWGLLHEESPKNNFLFHHKEVMTLFNHTATFKRQSDMPLTLQYLPGIRYLQSTRMFIPTAKKNEIKKRLKIASVVYVQSDCNVPSDRDAFVKKLMEYMPVDSYGSCVHNKDLPKSISDAVEGMDKPEFYNLMSHYKFTITFENAICDDYITEKLWRPLYLGSVPIVFGSPKLQDYLPDNKSAIVLTDFKSVEDLAKHIKYLDENDKAYDEYLQFKRRGFTNTFLNEALNKRTWGINNDRRKPSMMDELECLICRRIHENQQREADGLEPIKHIAGLDHYGCPVPLKFGLNFDIPQTELNDYWQGFWRDGVYEAEYLSFCVKSRRKCSGEDFRQYSYARSQEKIPNIV